ncbi:MAG: dihydroorotate dehydrogenase-like protein [Bacteroidales bacterium]|nr:dihydroorotate dehydrogenase-like protein [Bacteroidales bacterium]
MANLNTKYLGLELKSPVVIGASNMVTKPETMKKLEENGAGAIVYKSLFEEQIQLENLEQSETMEEFEDRNPEMLSVFPDVEHAGPKDHLNEFKKAKELINIPLIASINAIYIKSWIDYAKQFEQAGADALELNFYAVPRDFNISAFDIEQEQIDILKAVKKAVRIPVSVKISSFYTNILHVVKQMDNAGADGIVIFNRLFEPDISTEDQKHITPLNLSNDDEYRLSLRYSGILYKNINADIIGSQGVYEGEDIAKLILAGSDSVQAVSTFYVNKPEHLKKMLDDLSEWMKIKGYKSLDDFRGKLSRKNIKDYKIYKRAQYVDLLMHAEDVFKKYRMP